MMSDLKPSDVSLIVPVWNGGTTFARCLAAIQALSPQPGELIVVDDGSTDESRLRAHEAGARVLQTVRSGPGQARNFAAAQARGEILYFVDADVLVKPDAIARVLEPFRRDLNLAALYGSYDEEPSARNFISQYKNLFHHFVHQDATGTATSFWAGCGAIRRDVFLCLGGFSREYRRPSIEDIELGYRLKKAGYRSQLVKDLQVTHLKHWTLRSLIETDVRDRAIPWTRLILRDHEFPTDLNLKLAHRVSVVLVCALIGSLAAGLRWSWLWWINLVCVSALLALNRRLYQFFAARCGWRFALRAIPLHWFYYLYSGFAFALVLVERAITTFALWRRDRPTVLEQHPTSQERT